MTPSDGERKLGSADATERALPPASGCVSSLSPPLTIRYRYQFISSPSFRVQKYQSAKSNTYSICSQSSETNEQKIARFECSRRKSCSREPLHCQLPLIHKFTYRYILHPSFVAAQFMLYVPTLVHDHATATVQRALLKFSVWNEMTAY